MGRRYKLPFLSLVAERIAMILPYRIHAIIWINAYDSLREHEKTVYDRGSVEGEGLSIEDVVSAIRIETLRRRLFLEELKATYEK